jgi:hypothetical protein
MQHIPNLKRASARRGNIFLDISLIEILGRFYGFDRDAVKKLRKSPTVWFTGDYGSCGIVIGARNLLRLLFSTHSGVACHSFSRCESPFREPAKLTMWG